jgi:hypothetical protein
MVIATSGGHARVLAAFGSWNSATSNYRTDFQGTPAKFIWPIEVTDLVRFDAFSALEKEVEWKWSTPAWLVVPSSELQRSSAIRRGRGNRHTGEHQKCLNNLLYTTFMHQLFPS